STMTALTPSRMRRLISSLVNLLSSSPPIPPSMLNPQNTRHYLPQSLQAMANAIGLDGNDPLPHWWPPSLAVIRQSG
ncbi:hypothetical protein NW809_10585, partial [Synechococcus sp. WC101]|uniref:hypothetical protein n=1 Tax=Synechococcus sp. WC101 TaxID=2964536 RepID=UPI0039C3AAE0